MNTNSLVNATMGNSAAAPVVGMGATELGWTDRHAYTVTSVSKNGKVVQVQQDTATRTDKNGMSESQSYDFTPNPEGSKRTVTLRKNGCWVAKGGSMKGGTRFAIGHRSEYHDYSF